MPRTLTRSGRCRSRTPGPTAAGGKYLILPPDRKGQAHEGYIVLPFETLLAKDRSVNPPSHSDADIAKAAAYGNGLKFYPLSQAATVRDDVYRRNGLAL